MRLHFQLSPNRRPVPFEYASQLTTLFHSWLGHNNAQHNALSLYSLGWIQNPRHRKRPDGFDFPFGAHWFLSAPDTPDGQALLERVIETTSRRSEFLFGMDIVETSAQSTPDFGPVAGFRVGSPVFIHGDQEEEPDAHILWDHPRADELLTRTLRRKLAAAGLAHLSEGASVRFDRSYPNPKSKLITVKEGGAKPFRKRASFCPIVVEGQSPEAVKFAWCVGVGGLTGMGFGSLI